MGPLGGGKKVFHPTTGTKEKKGKREKAAIFISVY